MDLNTLSAIALGAIIVMGALVWHTEEFQAWRKGKRKGDE